MRLPPNVTLHSPRAMRNAACLMPLQVNQAFDRKQPARSDEAFRWHMDAHRRRAEQCARARGRAWRAAADGSSLGGDARRARVAQHPRHACAGPRRGARGPRVRVACRERWHPPALRLERVDVVDRGPILGAIGNWGNSDGPHPHFHVTEAADAAAAPLGEGVPQHTLLTRSGRTATITDRGGRAARNESLPRARARSAA
jgi:hypothetical protein